MELYEAWISLIGKNIYVVNKETHEIAKDNFYSLEEAQKYAEKLNNKLQTIVPNCS